MPSILDFSSSPLSPLLSSDVNVRSLKRMASSTSLMEHDATDAGQAQPRLRKKRQLLPTLATLGATTDEASGPAENEVKAAAEESSELQTLAHLYTVRAGLRQGRYAKPLGLRLHTHSAPCYTRLQSSLFRNARLSSSDVTGSGTSSSSAEAGKG